MGMSSVRQQGSCKDERDKKNLWLSWRKFLECGQNKGDQEPGASPLK